MRKSEKRKLRWGGAISLMAVLIIVPLLAACAGPSGPSGAIGPAGERGPAGSPGEPAAVPTFAIKFDPNEPGCGGVCHEVVSQAPYLQPNVEGKYTLAYEANHAYKGHNFDPLGKLLTLNDCQTCHAVGAGDRAGKGNVASNSIRDIVHKVHISSPHFEAAQLGPEVLAEAEEAGEARPGDCFTCHVVSGPSTAGL